jgi:hypothetical protein
MKHACEDPAYRLRVSQVDSPFDRRIGFGNFRNEPIALVVPKDSKARSLPLKTICIIAKPAFWIVVKSWDLRPDEIFVGTISKPGDSDSGMDASVTYATSFFGFHATLVLKSI